MQRIFAHAGIAVVALVILFNVVPLVVIFGSSFNDSVLLEFPPRGFTLDWYADALQNSRWFSALLYSVGIGLCVATLATAICFCAALVTVRVHFKGKGILELLALSPLVLPHAATALVLFRLVDSLGLLGDRSGLVVAHLIMMLPFSYLLCVSGLRRVDPSLEEAAMSLGARPLAVFVYVTLPLMKTALAGSFLFCFLMSFDEATVALFLRGIDLITLPVAIYIEIADNASPLISAMSVLLILLTILMVWIAQHVAGLGIFVSQRD